MSNRLRFLLGSDEGDGDCRNSLICESREHDAVEKLATSMLATITYPHKGSDTRQSKMPSAPQAPRSIPCSPSLLSRMEVVNT